MGHEELPMRGPDRLLRLLHWILRMAAYALAITMVVVILEGVASVVMTVYKHLVSEPWFIIPNIVQTFGAFLAVLIAYEIFANITLYIRTDVFPLKLVLATAMMAVARKIIVMDDYAQGELIGMGALLLGLGLAYWLVAMADLRTGPAQRGAIDMHNPPDAPPASRARGAVPRRASPRDHASRSDRDLS
ncbi:MAG: hypothetical protein EA400_05105 [Chromatiaceae bacterium]|nr:MAG: hypothetical protein EA400_05105 [Chromatiaceae bacterium]